VKSSICKVCISVKKKKQSSVRDVWLLSAC
jgi:hypothetical protein